MNKFSELRKIKLVGNPFNKNETVIHPITLQTATNNNNYKVYPSQFFITDNKLSTDNKFTNEKVSRSELKNMEIPDLSLPITDILNVYNIDNYDELIKELKILENQSTMFRIVNIYTRLFFDTLKKNNSSLIKIFKIIFTNEKINEEKTNSFLNKWFENNKKDSFNLNICKDYKNFIEK
jgi:hypothetical protein